MLLFDLFTLAQQRMTREFGSLENHVARSLIIRQGDAANGIYIVFSGIVESVFYTESGRELQLATWGEHDFVGAPHVFGEATQQWSARALTNVELLHLNQDQLRSLINYSPDISISLIQALGYKGERYSELAQRLAFHTVQERLALTLLDTWNHEKQRRKDFDSLPIPSPLELSRTIGATRQAVGRAIRSLSKRGLLNVEKGRFHLPSTKALRDHISEEAIHFRLHDFAP
ncbi:MAG: Crp/Fnr family transcriptional regulator [Granulosicoccus sp.]